jgi:hypothetical protein
MEAWILKNEPFIGRAEKRYQTFELANSQVEALLAQTNEDLNERRSYAETKWGWYRTEIMPDLETLSRSFDIELRNWQDLMESNWVDYNIGRAISECRRLIKFCNGVLLNLAQVFEKADRKQTEIENKAIAVMRLLQTRASRLTQSEKEEIKVLVEIAQQYSNFDFAKKLLESAHAMALRRADVRVRSDVTNIIYIYSRGGPVFLERVINSGNIAGAIRVLQSKGLRHHEKKR